MIVNTTEIYGLAALTLVVGLAFWRGGTTERRVAVIIALAWVGSVIVDDDATRGVQWAIFAVDIVLALYLISEGLFGHKIWPIAAAAAQIMITLTHVAFWIDPDLVQEAFFSAYYVWSYIVLTCLFFGCLFASQTAKDIRPHQAIWRRPGRPTGSE